ncbi:hypothetical protein DENSPDRAFT_833665 [Dentipellis sp. KUC8613]|nr:hypothetical protein DENSPDRAFT_833665 [Dentipellis sp. KUC8613]
MSPLPKRSSIFVFKDVSAENYSLPVNKVAIVGTFTGDVYHFQLYLVNSSADRSIRLDSHPSFTDMSDPNAGVVVIDHAPYMTPVAAEAVPPYTTTDAFECTVTDAIDANGIFDLIFNKKARDRYRFSDDGKGCRHWCATVIGDLEEAGLIAGDTVTRFERWEIEQASKLGATFPMPRIKGEFF